MLTRLGKSFKYALRGLVYVFKTEANFRIQVIIAALVLVSFLFFPLTKGERILVSILLALVLIMELLNTAMERLADLLKPRLNHYILLIKDIMAGVVLLTSLTAFGVGLYVYLPYLVSLVR
jgi:diacylglycerol kinase